MISKQKIISGSLLLVLISLFACDNKSTGPTQPALSVSLLSMDFGTDQLGLRFFINNDGESALEWNIEAPSQTWYEFSPAGGSITIETDTVEVLVDRADLTGNFADTLSITSNGGSAQVEILMQVPTSPTLSVYPLNLDFGVVDDTAFFRIVNTGPDTLDWSISENIDWLSLDNYSGSSAGEADTILAVIQRPNISNDILSGEILVSSNGGSTTVQVTAHDTLYEGGGIYTFLIMERKITRQHMGNSRNDLLTARFDSVYSACAPSIPLVADSVFCSEYELLWNADIENFEYFQNMPRTFLTLGEIYFFNIIGNSDVPSILDSVTFPLYAPYLTSPIDSAVFSRNADLGLEWIETGENQVDVSLILSSDSLCAVPYNTTGLHGINFSTENDGQHTLLSTQLSQLDPGEYRLVLTNYNAHGISAIGYDPDSFIMAKTTSYVTIHLQ